MAELAKVALIALGLFTFAKITAGCRPNCEGENGISESLRPFFSECMTQKLGTILDWKYLVDYVVWDDKWYEATENFFCKGKNEACWIKQLENLVKRTSYSYPHIKNCILEYAAWDDEDGERPCENADIPVSRPGITQKFSSLAGCPVSQTVYTTCMKASMLRQTAIIIVKPGQEIIKPAYKMIQLGKFLMTQRANCRINQIGTSYITICAEKSGAATSPVVRTKRQLTLRDILANATGGRINFQLSGFGTARILPSDAVTSTGIKAPKCLGQKLQMVLKSGTHLSTAISTCNIEANKGVATRRVSTSFIVARPTTKQPGQVGECKRGQVWSKWFNIDDPTSGTGDMEYYSRIRRKYRYDVCLRPTAVQALLVRNNQSYTMDKQEVKIAPTFGLSCHNYKQKSKKCQDYKVRFCCQSI